jgi:hypothetical protein
VLPRPIIPRPPCRLWSRMKSKPSTPPYTLPEFQPKKIHYPKPRLNADPGGLW